jgi:hypothetical protein
MKTAIAVRAFRRSDTKEFVKVGQRITGESTYLDSLARQRLVREVAAVYQAPEIAARPMLTVGTQSSASPAVPVLLQTTVNASENGGRKRRRKAAPSS